jgi:hypothetical protein
MITEEVICIDVDLSNDSAQAKPNDTPVMPRCAPAPRFPAVHPLPTIGVFSGNENSPAGFQQIFFFGEKFIVSDQRSAAETCRR